MPTTLFAQLQHHHPEFAPGEGDDADVAYIPPKHLYIIKEHESEYDSPSLIPTVAECKASDKSRPDKLPKLPRPTQGRRPPRQLTGMATLTYSRDPTMALAGAPGSPPDLTNSKSSKSSSFHSSTLSDITGSNDLTHFEDINLDDLHAGPNSFPIPASPSNRVVFEASRASTYSLSKSRSTPHAAQHSFRDLTAAKPRYPSLKGANNVNRQLNAPGRQQRRGFTSPSAPSLAAPTRRSRSPTPSHPQAIPSAARSLSRKPSRKLAVSPAPSLNPRRQSWQHGLRKSVKELEAECDDEDDEVPEDAILENVPISPRPTSERSPAPSIYGSPPQTAPSPALSRASSLRADAAFRPSPPVSVRTLSSQSVTVSPDPNNRESFLSTQDLSRQRTNTWEGTYTTLDTDAKKLTEALEEYQTDIDHQQEVIRQQPGLSRSNSVDQPKPKPKALSLPPIRKSDPLIDPFQPSEEKQKYLSRTRPSWLPPKDPKEEKKHLKEYQKMRARIQETDLLNAQRQEEEALAREKAERIKAEYWSNLLLPNWTTEMSNPENKGTHRKMWWNGIPAKLRGNVWKQAIGNDLELTEQTFKVALDKAIKEIKQLGPAAFNGRHLLIAEHTKSVFPELKVFAPQVEDAPEQPLHQDLVNVCLAYSAYRPDVDSSSGVPAMAGLLLLNMSPADTFVTLSNLLNRPLPLSFLVNDPTATTAAYDSTLSALGKKFPSLAVRLGTLRVEPYGYLYPMFSSLFCDRLPLEHAARIMDVYTVEGDKIAIRVAVALLGILEGNCYQGGIDEILTVMSKKEIRDTPDEFMGKVYEAGKSSS
ncbi:rab-GTPase-TBC domain-containing protein [Massariosphaeria phaeospora]|uniref:Rab-GTPase-TBC domain-containing protein n=1 Tax=Massariosphaeria phaeospora TaxID=100035 RepID=A0A7C8MDZ7_9PLEO|nr:rab-GTPase-TBC domain-containing protein [Massariosphaeria phaeospora]